MFALMLVIFLFKQKTAYEVRISDWSSDVCSSDLLDLVDLLGQTQFLDDDAHAPRIRRGQAAIQAHPALGVTHGNGVCRHDCRLSPPAATSEARRAGKGCGSTCRARWSPDA